MTAEIAVMNEEAIALAADSAVTGPKIFTSANKIFALSKYHPVAVMVFDSAQFLNVPWETIIKQYRRELRDRCFPTLSDHADHFLKFFNRAKALFSVEAQERGVAGLAHAQFNGILASALGRIQERIDGGEEPSEEDVIQEIEETISLHHKRWTGAPEREGLPKTYRETVRKKYKDVVNKTIEAVFEQVQLSQGALRQLRQLIPEVAARDERLWLAPQHSGIVVAGFGSDDVFPRLRRFHFESIIANRLKFTEDDPVEVGPNERAVIVPFAQAEQVATFMEGIDPHLRQYLHEWWRSKLGEVVGEVGAHLEFSDEQQAALVAAFEERCTEIVGREYEGGLAQFSHENNVGPIINIVGMLPKDELAAMAESLVNLTSFKRRVTPEAETVGGPIDVAVISRGDGFIWIKRKHYFNTELNPHFLANYYRDERYGKSK